MANTTFGNLKINFLRHCGNQYNANDATRLELAGSCINQALGIIQGEIKGHPFTLDTGNTVNTTANQAYVNLTDTDIIEVLSVQEKVDPSKLFWIPFSVYREYMADPSRYSGTPNLFYTLLQSVNVSGQNIWQILFVPTPSSAIAIYYDYIKNLQFSSNGTSANAAFSPLPTVYDSWIYEEAKPIFYEIIDHDNDDLINRSKKYAVEARIRYKSMIMAGAEQYTQVRSARDGGVLLHKQVGSVTL
jgi:hypothetical protein